MTAAARDLEKGLLVPTRTSSYHRYSGILRLRTPTLVDDEDAWGKSRNFRKVPPAELVVTNTTQALRLIPAFSSRLCTLYPFHALESEM